MAHVALSLEAVLCAVVSSDCINKEARGISIALQIIRMKKKLNKSRLGAQERTGLVPQSRQTTCTLAEKLSPRGRRPRPWKRSLAWSQNPRLHCCPGFSLGWALPRLHRLPVLTLTAARYPRRGLGILVLEVLLAFISLLSSP